MNSWNASEIQVLWAVLLRKFDSSKILRSFGPQLVLPQGVLTSAGALFPSNVAWPEMSTDLCPATRALSPKPLSSFVNYMIIWYLKSDTVISFERGGPIEQPAALENFWLAGFPAVSHHDASAVESVPYREFPCEKPMQIHADPCSFKSNLKALFNISWMLWKFADLAAWYLRHLFS